MVRLLRTERESESIESEIEQEELVIMMIFFSQGCVVRKISAKRI